MVRINEQQYRNYRRAAGIHTKDGVWDITVFPNGLYCFPLKMKLGINGRIDSPLINQTVIKKSNGKVYTIDNVNVHYYGGYYYSATLRDSNNSHATCFIKNINSHNEIILDGIARFIKQYEFQYEFGKEQWETLKTEVVNK